MHRTLSPRWLTSAANTAERSSVVEVPLFLCPRLSRSLFQSQLRPVSNPLSTRRPSSPWRDQRRCLQTQAEVPASELPLSAEETSDQATKKPVRSLPKQCTGCGAMSQTRFPEEPGFYDLNRKALRRWLGLEESKSRERHENRVYEVALRSFDPKELEKLGVDMENMALSVVPQLSAKTAPPAKQPLCERCHDLLHNNRGNSIYHPSVDALRDTIEETPYKYNHVYHIIDAADFPMSLLPRISDLLDLMPLRTKNRRSRTNRFLHGKNIELSFIITRADLLGRGKTEVDRLLPYIKEVLRDALGRSGREVRLGNVRLVSARSRWWTKELKEDIWKRGGGGWMVGKVNVGKSRLFEAVFPKGRMDWSPTRHQINVDLTENSDDVPARLTAPKTAADLEPEPEPAMQSDVGIEGEEDFDEFSLLPPAPREVQYPEMPLVHQLPGTTASPIRVPFGNGRGELIDMPGLERTGLEKYIKPEHRLDMIMKQRIVPEQQVLKQGQSILIGGLIRITPRVPGPIVLAYAFTPLEPHLTNTEKAIAIQEQTSTLNVDSIAAPGTGEKIKLAGSFPLKWDVTKQRSGPLTNRTAVGFKVEQLPYRVLSADILIEGVGWVEVTAQVRAKDLYAPVPRQEPEEDPEPAEPERELTALERLEALGAEPKAKKAPPPTPPKSGEEAELNWPVVDVYSPEGKFIGVRKPLNGWMINKPKITAAQKRSRPRKSMKGAKKMEKKLRRERESAAAPAF